MKKLVARLADGRLSNYPDPGSCWEWQLTRDRSGYGVWGNPLLPTKRAHRVVWILLRGPIPEGMYVDHKCRNVACCNPDHLRVVTPKVNSLQNSTGVSAIHAYREDCLHGHGPLTENPYVPGTRRCATCAAEINRANQRRRKALGIVPQTPIMEVCRKGLHRLLDDDGNPTRDLLLRSDGRRECRGCHRERQLRRYHASRLEVQPESSVP